MTRSRADARGVRASSAASHPGVRAACRARTVKEFMRPEPLADDEDARPSGLATLIRIKREKNEANEELECPVCLDARKDLRLDPCGHLVCSVCGDETREHPDPLLTCPICKAPITKRDHVFL